MNTGGIIPMYSMMHHQDYIINVHHMVEWLNHLHHWWRTIYIHTYSNHILWFRFWINKFTVSNLTGTLPAISGANLTNLTAGNLTGALLN